MFFPIGDDQIKGGYFPLFSYGFIALNVLVFLFQISMPEGQLNAFIFEYGAIPAETSQQQDLFTILTSMFLHGGYMHLLGNMLFLWIFADNIEATIGNLRFLLFYLAGGIAAYLAHYFTNMQSTIPTVGASGAISAVMGAYLIMFPRSRIKVFFFFFVFRISAFVFLGLWIAQEFFSGMAALQVSTSESSGVAYWAHIGGFVFGVVMGLYFRMSQGREQKMADGRYV